MKTLSTSLFVFLAAAAFALCAAAEDFTTLTIRTSDGLILLKNSGQKLLALRETLAENSGPLDTARALGALRGAEDAPTGMDVYYSARPGAQWRKPEVEKMPLEDAVRKGLVPNVIGHNLIDAYILMRANGMDMRLLGEPPPEAGLVGGAVVTLHSSMIGERRSSIMVNGEVFNISGSGYLLIVMNPEGEKVTASAEYKTFSDFEPAEKMERFLNGQPEDSILLGVDFLGPGVFISGGAIDAMRRYGIQAPMDPQIPTSHAFVGRKGLPPGKGVEAIARAQDSTITIFPEASYMNESEISSLRESASNISTVVISGTAPGSETVITR